MADSKYVKAGAAYTIGNYLLKGISFLTLPIFVRLMTSAEYGNFNTYLAYESILTIVVSLALYASLKNARYQFTTDNGFESYVSSCILLSILSTILFLIFGNLIYPFVVDFVDMSRLVFNLLIIHSYATSLLTLYQSYLSIFYKYKGFLLVSFINVLANVALSVLLMFSFLNHDKFLARVLGSVVPVILIGLFIIFRFFKIGGHSINTNHWKYGLAFSLPLIFHGISQVILNQFDRIMIKRMTGASNAGVYSFAYNLSCLVAITATSLQQIWQPWFYERMVEKDIGSIKKRGDQFAFGMMLFIVCVVLGIKEVADIVGTDEYGQSIFYLIPLLLGGYFSFLYLLPSQVEYFYEKTKYIAVGTCVAAILNIVFNYFGILYFGSIAAAYTTLIVYCIYFFIHFYISIRVHGSAVFQIGKIILYCLTLVSICAISLFLVNYWYLRWSLLIVVGCYLLYWSVKTFDVLNAIKSKIAVKK